MRGDSLDNPTAADEHDTEEKLLASVGDAVPLGAGTKLHD